MEGKKDPWALVGLVSWRTSPSESFPDLIGIWGPINSRGCWMLRKHCLHFYCTAEIDDLDDLCIEYISGGPGGGCDGPTYTVFTEVFDQHLNNNLHIMNYI